MSPCSRASMLGTTSASTNRRTASRTISCSSDHSNMGTPCPSPRRGRPLEAVSGRPVRGYPSPAYSRDVQLGRKPDRSAFERWGGEPFFTALVDRFYAGVAADPTPPAAVPRGPDRAQGPPGPLPHAVLGRAEPLQRAAGPPPAADAPCPLRHRPSPGRGLARSHDRRRARVRPPRTADQAELLDYLTMAAQSLINAPV